MKKKLLIDALSTSSGGAIIHLKNILDYFDKQEYFDQVDVFIPDETKLQMPKNKRINYFTPYLINKNLIFRIIWQTIFLNILVRFKKYDCIFITGSSHFLFSKKVVSISQNLLPFSPEEIKKYFFSLFYLKLILLKVTQILSFKMSDGLIFLHKFSKNKIMKVVKNTKAKIKIIPHGVDLDRLKIKKKFTNFRIIYISNIDHYKNQDFVIKAGEYFFNKNPKYKNKILFEFYGSHYPPALNNMKNILNSIKNKKNFKYFGLKNKNFIFKEKFNSNIIILFSSSCENFSVTLIEAMAMGVPILCINRQPMKSVLGNGGIIYKHNSYKSFENSLLNLINSKSLRKKISNRSFKRSKLFKSNVVAKKTFDFLNKIASLR